MKNKTYLTDAKYDWCENWTQKLSVECEGSYHLAITDLLGKAWRIENNQRLRRENWFCAVSCGELRWMGVKFKKNIFDFPYFKFLVKATIGLRYKFTQSQQCLTSLYSKMNDNLWHQGFIKQGK